MIKKRVENIYLVKVSIDFLSLKDKVTIKKFILIFEPTIPVEGKEETEFASEKYYTSQRYVLCVSVS